MLKTKRLVLSYTAREWIFIENSISKSGNKNGVISHIIKEVSKLDCECNDVTEENKESLTKIKKRQFYPPDLSIDILERLAKKLNIPPSTIVSRLIINPLLQNGK